MSDEPFDRGHRFPTTQWTLVGHAGLEFDPRRRDALDELLRRYWPALKLHLTAKKRIDPNEADDLVQGFVESKLLEKNLVAAAERGRGKFRSLLATALENYVVNEMQRRGAKKRIADRASSLDEDGRGNLASGSATPDSTFDVAWARELLADVVRRVKQECEDSEREDLWIVLESRILRPIMEGAEPVGYDELIERCGFKTPSQASNALITAKRMFARQMRTVIGQYAMDEADIEQEIRDLESILAGRGSL